MDEEDEKSKKDESKNDQKEKDKTVNVNGSSTSEVAFFGSTVYLSFPRSNDNQKIVKNKRKPEDTPSTSNNVEINNNANAYRNRSETSFSPIAPATGKIVRMLPNNDFWNLYTALYVLAPFMLAIMAMSFSNYENPLLPSATPSTSTEPTNNPTSAKEPTVKKIKSEECYYWKSLKAIISGGFQVEYGGHLISCSSESKIRFRKLLPQLKFDCQCHDVSTRRLVKCKNYESASGSCEHTLAELIRNLAKENIYPRPCDDEKMPTDC